MSGGDDYKGHWPLRETSASKRAFNATQKPGKADLNTILTEF